MVGKFHLKYLVWYLKLQNSALGFLSFEDLKLSFWISIKLAYVPSFLRLWKYGVRSCSALSLSPSAMNTATTAIASPVSDSTFLLVCTRCSWKCNSYHQYVLLRLRNAVTFLVCQPALVLVKAILHIKDYCYILWIATMVDVTTVPKLYMCVCSCDHSGTRVSYLLMKEKNTKCWRLWWVADAEKSMRPISVQECADKFATLSNSFMLTAKVFEKTSIFLAVSKKVSGFKICRSSRLKLAKFFEKIFYCNSVTVQFSVLSTVFCTRLCIKVCLFNIRNTSFVHLYLLALSAFCNYFCWKMKCALSFMWSRIL